MRLVGSVLPMNLQKELEIYMTRNLFIYTASLMVAMACTAVNAQSTLYTQSVVTSAGGGAGGADFSLANTEFGRNLLSSSNYRVASDFVLSSDASVSSIIFQAYQTNSGTATSPFSGIDAKIWSARPGDAGASVIFSSTTLGSNSWANLYRGNVSSNTQRPVFDVEAIFSGANLSAGTYWLDVSMATTNGNNAFAPVFEGVALGETSLQYDNGWTVLGDNVNAYEFGFTVKGTNNPSGGAVPEPSEWAAIAMFAGGLTGLVLRKRRLSN
jgi:hypothetical protein